MTNIQDLYQLTWDSKLHEPVRPVSELVHLKSVIDCFPYFYFFQLLVFFIQVHDFPTVLDVIIVFFMLQAFSSNELNFKRFK